MPAIALSQPHGSYNLIELYELEDAATRVARKDAKGDKINKIRRSYENYVKDIPGRDKIRKVDRELVLLNEYPDEDYHNTNVHGKEIAAGLSDDIMSKLAVATKIDGGQLSGRDEKYWRDIVDPESQPIKSHNVPSNAPKKAPNSSTQPTATSPYGYETSRPARRGAKRKYNDESFEGYGDHFADDAADVGSPDTLDDADAGSTAKRKKRRVGRPRKNETSDPSSPIDLSTPYRARSSRNPKNRG